VLTEVVRLPEDSRRASARAVNVVMTATYWEVGRRIVEGEQSGPADRLPVLRADGTVPQQGRDAAEGE
jgi:hypothetical protein